MAKLYRHKDKNTKKETDINLETGEVNDVKPDAWKPSLFNKYKQACSLVEQVEEVKLGIVDNTNISIIANSLAIFGDKGRELFIRLCVYQTQFNTEQVESAWQTAVKTSKARGIKAFVNICAENSITARVIDDGSWDYFITERGKDMRNITDELTDEQHTDLNEWGFMEYGNCYYFTDRDYEKRRCRLVPMSNFTIKVLFHIRGGKKDNKRVIEMRNNRGRFITMDIDTKQMSSLQLFRELTEGNGNFLFKGGATELMTLKGKLFEKELQSDQIEVLGWNKKGKFFAFANGIYNCRFWPCDKNGIVMLDGHAWYIKYHPGTEDLHHSNEKLFSFKPRWPEHSPDNARQLWQQWSQLYCQAFGEAGRVALLFGVATLYSDFIFDIKRNFPMLFLYGEGGSGKSRVGTYLQYLWGDPQPPLKLSDRANTDKARIRKLAQYTNAMALFEEFINELDMSIIKTITGIYDRFGYERSNLNSSYGTETVPINSTVMITGNAYPNDDPLMQRLILIDYNTNIRDEAVVKAYDELTRMNREGITEITGWLLQYRTYVMQHFEFAYREYFNWFKKECQEEKITVPDRMIENYAVIITINAILEDAGVPLPFTADELTDFLITTIRAQSEKRDVGSVTQRFWDIFLQLASEAGPGGRPVLRYGKEYDFNGNYVFIRWTEVHGLYMEKHSRVYRSPGLGKSTMLQKLADSGQMADREVKWVDGKTRHGYKFYYDKINIDLLGVVEYWRAFDARPQAAEPEKGQYSGIFDK